MARAKKDGKPVNLYLSREFLAELDEYCEKMGQARSVAVERIVKSFLDESHRKK